MNENNSIKNAVEEYLAVRKILPETAQAFGVYGDSEDNIVFPYYDNMEAFEKGDAAFQKRRPARKLDHKEAAQQTTAEGKPILFGMHLCDPAKGALYFFENEFECMAGYQAHGCNCVSIPDVDSDFSWNTECAKFISGFRRAAVITSNTDSGRKLALEISRKLEIPADMPDKKLYKNHKSISAVLYKEGDSGVSDIIDSAKPEPIPELMDISKIPLLSVKEIPLVMTGIKELDRATRGFHFGGVDVWTGKTGEGKSTFLSQMMLEAIEQGYKVFVYSGELEKEQFKRNMYAQASGTAYMQVFTDERTGRTEGDLIPEVTERIDQWIEGRFWLCDKNFPGIHEPEKLLKLIEHAYRAYDCRVFLIDNMMTINTTGKGRESYDIESDFTGRLCQMASKFGILIHLVIHPKKTGGRPVMYNDDIGGSLKNANLASAVFSVRKVKDKDEKHSGQNAAFSCMKGRNKEADGSIPLEFRPISNQFTSPNCPERKYSWDATGLSMEPADQLKMDADELPF